MYILGRVPVRTSTVVTVGMILLTVAGVAAVFGGSIVALVSPPPAEESAPAVASPTTPAADTAPGSTPVDAATRPNAK